MRRSVFIGQPVMNYRHAFHAGGFADVLKHAALVRILIHLGEKPAPFRVIDTHAGAGLYDLSGGEANRTGEWRDGIGRLVAASLAPSAQALLAPYLTAVAQFSAGEKPHTYPGSPALAASQLRPQDRLIACELEPEAARMLAGHFHGDDRVKVIAIDGWMAANAYIPPKERRGLVLIDPAFEQTGEFDRLAETFIAAHRKWPTGIFMLWHPIKKRAEADAFARRLARSGIAKMLHAELSIAPPRDAERLGACGLVIASPPWKLESELAVILPALADALGRDRGGGYQLDWLAPEK